MYDFYNNVLWLVRLCKCHYLLGDFVSQFRGIQLGVTQKWIDLIVVYRSMHFLCIRQLSREQ